MPEINAEIPPLAREEIEKKIDALSTALEIAKNDRDELRAELEELNETIRDKQRRHDQLKRLLARHA